MKLAWTPDAVADREAIFEYIAADNPIAALDLDELFEQQASRLLLHPELGRAGRVAGTREWVLHRNYVCVYDLVTDQLRVLRVLHVARQRP
ncbi:type II toxin-antitoxin system mRNA interferase toxin, RelE/StbE family [Chromobacterium haemolyticum]|uniref:Type II toxin-antitoxin system mRNA interferase toxin, RelE/StbE family n=1 Tax=Chromobacterium fluminis TaxID=3044269 RepID=A0ABX0L584_9NEIS|nr:type II toxin-antitoxin system mRNA interferase toxin, RelE/StbE family [Chromobacterium haemolyticum]NHR06143.1 type II toxin-antitoxin system mRNA interferase toxin, RelE/StbE family [Chromobacterium haemolyticum]OQS35703.1 addiction module toxin RelE [Chromobacterium haemolyticum]